jgi:hypothetical protein
MHLATIDDDEVFVFFFRGVFMANAEGIIVSAHDRRRTVRGIPFTTRTHSNLNSAPLLMPAMDPDLQGVGCSPVRGWICGRYGERHS